MDIMKWQIILYCMYFIIFQSTCKSISAKASLLSVVVGIIKLFTTLLFFKPIIIISLGLCSKTVVSLITHFFCWSKNMNYAKGNFVENHLKKAHIFCPDSWIQKMVLLFSSNRIKSGTNLNLEILLFFFFFGSFRIIEMSAFRDF